MIYSSPSVYGSAIKKLVYFGLPAEKPSVLKDPLVPHFDILLKTSILSLKRSVAIYTWFFFSVSNKWTKKCLDYFYRNRYIL